MVIEEINLHDLVKESKGQKLSNLKLVSDDDRLINQFMVQGEVNNELHRQIEALQKKVVELEQKLDSHVSCEFGHEI